MRFRGVDRMPGRTAETMRVSAVSPTAMGQSTPAAQMTGLAVFGPRVPQFRASTATKRRRTARTSAKRVGVVKKRRAPRVRGGKLVKGSAAAKAWGAKMRRARRRK